MFAQFFISRPIFAAVLSILLVLAGVISVTQLPVAQYPEIAPPTIQVTASYPGANAIDVARTVATPIEEQVNGVEDMLYMESKCTNDGQMNLTITFKVGTNLNMAQVLVQNRVNLAQAKLPDVVKSLGVNTKKKSPSITLVINLVSPDESKSQLDLSNYAKLQVTDSIARLDGVGDIGILGEREYSMRIWLDPLKMAAKGVTAIDVVKAIQAQNQQVAAGQIGQPPTPPKLKLDFQNTINVLGRLTEVKQFEDMVLKISPGKNNKNVRILRLKEVAEVELGAKSYDIDTILDGKPTVSLAVYQLPGSNALDTADAIRKEMDRLLRVDGKPKNPGIDYRIYYDTTPFIKESIQEVIKTLIEAIILVAIVVMVFLQNWRSALIPLIAVPVAIVGTFAVMMGLGFSLNNLTLFGLVLAIGIVVDDAIVVVESVEHHLAEGLSPKEATQKALGEVAGPVIAVALVLCAVFVPSAFISGITGQFYRQFALTIAVSTVLSAINSLTLSPALCAILLQPKNAKKDILGRFFDLTLGWFFFGFNRVFDFATGAYSLIVKILVRGCLIILLLYVGLLVLTGYVFTHVPTGFIPAQDKGYLIVDIQLPEASALKRTRLVANLVDEIARSIPGVSHDLGIPGNSVVTGSNSPNVATFFFILESFEERHTKEKYYLAILNRFYGFIGQIQQMPLDRENLLKLHKALPSRKDIEFTPEVEQKLREQCSEFKNAQILAFGPPPVDGLGSTGGFKMQIQDKGPLGFDTLQGIIQNVVTDGRSQPGLVGVASTFRSNTPRIEVVIDREKAMAKNIDINDLFKTLQYTFASYYVNDITLLDRNFQVNISANANFRSDIDSIGRLRINNKDGVSISLATFVDIRYTSGPSMVTRYNMFSSAPVFGGTLPGTSSGQAISLMEKVAAKELPDSMGYEWTDLSYQEVKVGNTTTLVFALSVLLVFLVLSAQYESWGLPFAVILIVPMCLLCAAVGVAIAKMDINIFTQIGLIVLVGLSSKNAILIVEFAKQEHEAGKAIFDATIAACRLRLRPILMTSFAFILGVVPLVFSTGAGAEMRKTLGTAVFSGMLGVTFFGIFLTPVFYFVIQWLLDRFQKEPKNVAKEEQQKPHS